LLAARGDVPQRDLGPPRDVLIGVGFHLLDAGQVVGR
jgi:hypothetical protein